MNYGTLKIADEYELVDKAKGFKETLRNIVLYWGQNSYGSKHLDTKAQWERPLEKYCNDSSVNIISLSFLNNLNGDSDLPPELNLSYHCATLFNNKVLNCPGVGQDIEYCQKMGKKVLLTIGGAIANTDLKSPEIAERVANDIWNMYMGGHHSMRPFHNATLDGINLNLESGNQNNYDVFLKTLRSRFNNADKEYYVTASPQCVYPDNNLQVIMDNNHMDALFIQFYNNLCGMQNYNPYSASNWNVWENWARKKSINSKVKLFLGVPATASAASYGYVEPSQVVQIAKQIKKKSQYFGGVAVWDASQNTHSAINNKTMSETIRAGFEGTRPKPKSAKPKYGLGSRKRNHVFKQIRNSDKLKFTNQTSSKLFKIPRKSIVTSNINKGSPAKIIENPIEGGKC
ncbi:Chitinase 2 [Massospora cicadina]|nr:Chitinase 2 [Massospora cicadina]